MSVVGIDIGNSGSCVSLAQKRGIDVILNKESNRETPSIIYFGDKMRLMGTDAVPKRSMYPKNTIEQVKRLLGKKFNDNEVQKDIKKFSYAVEEGQDGECIIRVDFCGKSHTFSPEQIMAMILVDLKSIVTMSQGIGVTDCVIAVPAYYTEIERHAMLDAARIAGVNCLRLFNDTAATALAYGIFKSDLPEGDPVYVAFVDMGHSSLQVCIVALKKGQLKILSCCWNRNIGGRDYDEVLFEHFAAEFKQKTKLDVKNNPKACFRLRTNCEKTKKILSANTESQISVECLMEDMDYHSRINRETFDNLCSELTAQIVDPCQRAVEDAGLKVSQISSVEIVGSASRIKSFQTTIESFFGKSVSRTLNSKECVSRGCALQCAMLSPIFKVKEFEVTDAQPYSIEFSWEKEGVPSTNIVFERNSPYPSTRVLTFTRIEPFCVNASYVKDSLLPPLDTLEIAKFSIGPFAKPNNTEKVKLKARAKVNLHGILELEAVHSIEEEEYEVPVKEEKKENEENGKQVEEKEEEKTNEKQEEKEEVAVPVKMEKKVRTKKTNVNFKVTKETGLSYDVVNNFFEEEGKMAANDKLQTETKDRKNDVEGYVYSLRSRLDGELNPYVQEKAKDQLISILNKTEDWLYEDGADETKSVYISKLEELKKFGDPIELRYNEEQHRTSYAQNLIDVCQFYINLINSQSEAHAHLEQSEKDSVIKECQNALVWINKKMNLQAQLQKYDHPVVLTEEIYKKRDVLERFVTPIVNKPKPKPQAPPKEPEKPATESTEENKKNEEKVEEKKDENAMDVDSD